MTDVPGEETQLAPGALRPVSTSPVPSGSAVIVRGPRKECPVILKRSLLATLVALLLASLPGLPRRSPPRGTR